MVLGVFGLRWSVSYVLSVVKIRAIMEMLMKTARTSSNLSFLLRTPKRSLACWVDFLVCPRRYLAVLPARARANLFAGD